MEFVDELLRAFDDEDQRVGVSPACEVGDTTDTVFCVVSQPVHSINWQGFSPLVRLQSSRFRASLGFINCRPFLSLIFQTTARVIILREAYFTLFK